MTTPRHLTARINTLRQELATCRTEAQRVCVLGALEAALEIANAVALERAARKR